MTGIGPLGSDTDFIADDILSGQLQRRGNAQVGQVTGGPDCGPTPIRSRHLNN